MSRFNKSFDLLDAIIESSDDDLLRYQYAESVSAHDPARAEFIRLQLGRSSRQRASHSARRIAPSVEEEALLQRHGRRWANEVSEHCEIYEFHRGFISYIAISPSKFSLHAEEILKRSPIKHLGFYSEVDSAFSFREILEHPLLKAMDSLNFEDLPLDDKIVQDIASRPSLSSCLTLNLSHTAIGLPAFHALAASPHARGLLNIYRNQGASHDYTPAQRLIEDSESDPWRGPRWIWAPLGEDGVALEREFGYIPWLHPQDNACDKFDARWFVNQGILPKRPFGSPVEP